MKPWLIVLGVLFFQLLLALIIAKRSRLGRRSLGLDTLREANPGSVSSSPLPDSVRTKPD